MQSTGLCAEKSVDQWTDLVKSQYEIFQNDCTITDESDICLFWDNLSHFKDLHDNYRFVEVSSMVKATLCISHANVIPERGFSLNKNILEEKTLLSEDTIISLRMVKDHILLHDTVSNFPITKKLLTDVSKSRGMYHKYLDDKSKKKKI